ncbi:di-trans,poly-cis-decaprenylcistransferase [Halobacteriales archaeon QS_8_69_26]|nr:MAG: di-trans,poly-cis-decaprenylcistransferase [Halobacteriales archaeon QS_8_69_26]
MLSWARERVRSVYERHLEREISESPTHVAVIQDGNRRYAREQGHDDPTDGHVEGAETTQQLLKWCYDVGVEELTLYAFSTENFDRPAAERERLFDLLKEKLVEFADAEEIHENEVNIRGLGDVQRLPERAREAVEYAEERTEGYDRFRLNIALAYGGRFELLSAARTIAGDVDDGCLDPEDIDVGTVEDCLYGRPIRDVDLIIRTGGDERTSNFLPWHANGNEAAAFFCAPYWPEFSKTDFLRGIRTWENRENSWRRTRAERALALMKALGDEAEGEASDRLGERVDLPEARAVVRRFREHLPRSERPPAPEDEGERRAAD